MASVTVSRRTAGSISDITVDVVIRTTTPYRKDRPAHRVTLPSGTPRIDTAEAVDLAIRAAEARGYRRLEASPALHGTAYVLPGTKIPGRLERTRSSHRGGVYDPGHFVVTLSPG